MTLGESAQRLIVNGRVLRIGGSEFRYARRKLLSKAIHLIVRNARLLRQTGKNVVEHILSRNGHAHTDAPLTGPVRPFFHYQLELFCTLRNQITIGLF